MIDPSELRKLSDEDLERLFDDVIREAKRRKRWYSGLRAACPHRSVLTLRKRV